MYIFRLFVFVSLITLVSSAFFLSFKLIFNSIENTSVRKEVFFNYLLPAINQKNEEIIKDLEEKIIKLSGKPNLESDNQQDLIKNLTKQFDQLSVNSILSDKSKNIIKDETINKIKVRSQKVIDLPPKDLRKLVDIGKKELGEGIIIVFAIKDGKIGLAVGVTDKLTNKYDAVKFVKKGSEIVGGKGGGGRSDFAQAGGIEENKIDDAFDKLKSLI